MRGKLGISPEIVLAVRADAPGGAFTGARFLWSLTHGFVGDLATAHCHVQNDRLYTWAKSMRE
jgi:hypothetical protein